LGDLFARENPDIIGITGVSRTLPAVFKTAEIAREKLPNSVIVVGGPGSAHEPEKVLKSAKGAINFIVKGEGELTFFELVRGIESGIKDFGNIAGLVFLNQDGNLVSAKPRDYIIDLDSLPWPAYHLLYPDLSQYHGMKADHKETPRPVATMFASRGCPHRCIFCSLQSKLWRGRNPKDVVAEMEFYKNKFGAKSIQLYDDEFLGLTPKQNEWIKEICDEIIKRKLGLKFLSQGRCSPYIDLETLKKMKEAGFVWIWWGVESGSQKVLDIIKKDIKIENVFRDFALAREAGIKSLAFIVVGFPGETAADIKLTGDLLRKLKPDLVKIHTLIPWPGTAVRKYFEEKNLLTPGFDYYKLDMRCPIAHRTEELTSREIMKYSKYLSFRFERGGYLGLIKLGLKSLLTADGWRKLFKRIRIFINYFFNWLEVSRSS